MREFFFFFSSNGQKMAGHYTPTSSRETLFFQELEIILFSLSSFV